MAYTWVRSTASQVISTKPGWIGAVIVTPDSDDDTAYVSIFDGENTTEPKILRVRCKAGVTTIIRFQPPLATHRGLYVELEDHAEEVLIQHAWGDE